MSTATAGSEVLTRWFAVMDSDRPEDILDMIAPGFRFSIVFGTGGGEARDFAGGREAMEGYLAQREKGTLTHHPLVVSSTGPAEFYLGEVRRAGEVVANYVAAGEVGPSGRLRRLIIGRSPAVRFAGGTDV